MAKGCILHEMFQDVEEVPLTVQQWLDQGRKLYPGTLLLLTKKADSPMKNRIRIIIGSATPWHCTYNGKESDQDGFNYSGEDAGWNSKIANMYVREVFDLVDLAFDIDAYEARENKLKRLKGKVLSHE